MESCELTKTLVIFTSPGTSGGFFTGTVLSNIKSSCLQSSELVSISLGMTIIVFMFTIKEN